MATEIDPDRAVAVQLDVTDPASVREAERAVQRRWGGIDILVNNAGVSADSTRATADDRELDWDNTFAVNVRGTVRCCEAFLPDMQERRYGKIVNIASMAAHAQRRTNGAYATSKAAVLRYTKGLALQVAADRINVNAVCPGAVWTDLQRRDMAAARRRVAASDELSLEAFFETTTPQSSPSEDRRPHRTSARRSRSWSPTTRTASRASAYTSMAER